MLNEYLCSCLVEGDAGAAGLSLLSGACEEKLRAGAYDAADAWRSCVSIEWAVLLRRAATGRGLVTVTVVVLLMMLLWL